jgi:hypothetical protein
VLGAILARQVATHAAEGVPAAYGAATGHIFLICAGVAALSIVAAILLKPVTLRSRPTTGQEPAMTTGTTTAAAR